MKRAKINPISLIQSRKLKEWAKVAKQRRGLLIVKYGYLPCEWGKEKIIRGDPHHNDRDRNHNVFDNCRIVCRLHHTYITDHNITDVPDLIGELKLGVFPKSKPQEKRYLSGFGHGQPAPKPSSKLKVKERIE